MSGFEERRARLARLTARLAAEDGVLEARVPEVDPYALYGILALHSPREGEPCTDLCTTYDRRGDE